MGYHTSEIYVAILRVAFPRRRTQKRQIAILKKRWVDEIVNGESVTKTLPEQPEETKHLTSRTT
jgi:hypothetical protein